MDAIDIADLVLDALTGSPDMDAITALTIGRVGPTIFIDGPDNQTFWLTVEQHLPTVEGKVK